MNLWLGSLIFILSGLLIGLVFLALGFFLKKRLKNYKSTQEIVVSDYFDRYTIIEFVADDGNTYTYRPLVAVPVLPKKKGTKLILHYNPKNPKQVQIDSFSTNGNLFVILGICIAVLGIVGAFIFYYIATMISDL